MHIAVKVILIGSIVLAAAASVKPAEPVQQQPVKRAANWNSAAEPTPAAVNRSI